VEQVIDLTNPPAEVVQRQRAAHAVLTADLAAQRLEDIQGWPGVGGDARMALLDLAAELRAAVAAATGQPEPYDFVEQPH